MPLPAVELVFGLVVSLGVLPSLSFAVGGVRVDAGVNGAVGNSALGLLHRLGWLPHLDADYPLSVQELDVCFVNQALGQRVPQLDGAEACEFNPALAVVLDLGDAGGGAEGAGAGKTFLVETWRAGFMVSVAPVLDGGAKVHEGAFGDSAGYCGYEGVILAFAGVEGFVKVLPRGPGQTVGAAEAVSGDAEVVDESGDSEGTVAVALLFHREVNGY